jgi:hypothetical protein
MRAFILLICALICGCASIPEYRTCIPTNNLKEYTLSYCGSSWQEADVELYIKTFERMWNEDPLFPHDPEKLKLALNKIVLFWQPQVFRAPGERASLLGLTYSPINDKIRIYVYIPAACRNIKCTALGHELIHVAYGAVTGDMRIKHLTNSTRWPRSHYLFLDKVWKSSTL